MCDFDNIAKIGMKVHLVLRRVPRLLASVILSFAPLPNNALLEVNGSASHTFPE